MSLPLSHIRVVEMCQGLAGPMTAMHLADQGAEVIKVESPDGDYSRRVSPGIDHPNMSLRMLTFDRNKRAIVVDFTKPQGLEVIHGLVRQADVLVINLRIGARRRHGLTYEDMAAVNPRLVYGALTAYGDEGTEAELGAADVNIQARSGDLLARRPPGGPPPGQTALFHFDMSASILGFSAIMMALYERERTGKGQRVEFNLLQSSLLLEALQLTRVSGFDGFIAAKSNNVPSIYLCSDGRYMSAGVTGGRRGSWDVVCRALGLEALLEDHRFSSEEKRQQNQVEFHEVLSRYFATKSAAEWEAIFKGLDLPCEMLQEIMELHDDPQVIANDMIIQYEQPGVGQVSAVNAPFKMSDHLSDQRVRRPVPTLGQHTQEVLLELGYSLDKIEALKKEKVVA